MPPSTPGVGDRPRGDPGTGRLVARAVSWDGAFDGSHVPEPTDRNTRNPPQTARAAGGSRNTWWAEAWRGQPGGEGRLGSEPPANQREPGWLALGPGPRSPALPGPWLAPLYLCCPLGSRPPGSTHRLVPISWHLKLAPPTPGAPTPLTGLSTAGPSPPATVPAKMSGCYHPSWSLTGNTGTTPFTARAPRPGVPDTPW